MHTRFGEQMTKSGRTSRQAAPSKTAQEHLGELAHEATRLAKTARRHAKSLTGANFYANKMADLRADANRRATRERRSPRRIDPTAVATWADDSMAIAMP